MGRGGGGASDDLTRSRATPHPWPAPTRGGGGANVVDSTEMQHGLSGRARNPWAKRPRRIKRAPRRGRCAFSLARSRSRRSPKCPMGRLCASAGGEFCTTSRPSRGRSASPRPGGDMRERRRATISAPRIPKAAASGSIARAYGVARRRRRNGLCMACLGKRSTAPGALDARVRWRTTCRLGSKARLAKKSNRLFVKKRAKSTYTESEWRFDRIAERFNGELRASNAGRQGHFERPPSDDLPLQAAGRVWRPPHDVAPARRARSAASVIGAQHRA